MLNKLLGGLFAFAVLALVGMALWIALRPDPTVLLEELIAELRARGEPVTLADLETPLPSTANNGAHDLDQAMAWWAANEPTDDWETRVPGNWNPDMKSPWMDHATPEQMEELRTFLVFLAPLFEHVDQGATKPEIAWPGRVIRSAADFALNFGAEVTTLQTLNRFLQARSVAAATEEERLLAIRDTLAIGTRVRTRALLPTMVAVVTHGFGCLNLRDALESGAVDPIAARAELDALLQAAWVPRFPGIVRAERAGALDLLPFWIDGSLEKLTRRKNAIDRAVERIEQAVEGNLSDAPPTPAERVRSLRELDRYLDDEWDARDVGNAAEITPRSEIADVLPHVHGALVRGDAVAGLARLALAAYAYRQEHGVWPTTNADLGDFFPRGLPVDPYTGGAFIIEHDEGHLILRAQPWVEFAVTPLPELEADLTWRLPPR